MKNFIAKNQEKKILILGFGREGQSTYFHIRRAFKTKIIGISDKMRLNDLPYDVKSKIKKDKYLELYFGTGYLNSLKRYDVIIKTPGIPNKLKEIKEAKKNKIEVTSQTKVFFDECKGIIIGVTGTKGKSTTASIIYNILKTSGLRCVILGNIGKPPLDYLEKNFENTYFVFELSSHQLSDLTKSPHIAVLLNIYQEHLDYYENFEEYFDAKKNIARFQNNSDFYIYNFDDKNLKGVVKVTKAKILSFSKEYKKDSFVRSGVLFVRDRKNVFAVMKIQSIPLKGAHNFNNVMASTLVARSLGISIKAIRKGIKSFKSLPVRLEEVGVYKEILFVLDALATIPEATIAALNAYSEKVGTLICGGFDRGQDFSGLAKEIVKQKVYNLVLFPTTGMRIWEEINKLDIGKDKLPNRYLVNNMQDAIKTCYKITPKGKVCLLSAASSSFSIFKNYEEESQLFRKYIKSYSGI